MTVSIDAKGLDAKIRKALYEVPALARRVTKAGTLAAVSELKREAPVSKSVRSNPWQNYRMGGRLRSSITFVLSGDELEGNAGPTVDYAPCVVEGTRPHIILPRNKKALYWTGAVHPRKIVHHPGTEPNDFVSRARETVENERLPEIAERELKRSLAFIMGGL